MTIRENIDLVRNLSNKMPKTITEAMDFEEKFDERPFSDEDIPEEDEPVNFSEMDVDEPVDEPIEEPETEPVDNSAEGPDTSNAKELINSMRKQALRAMAEIADAPESEEYQMLKKVFQLLEKKPEAPKAE